MEFEYTFGDPVDKEKIRDAWTIWKRKANLFYFSPACKFLIRLIFHLIFVILISKFYLFDFNYMSHVWLEYYIALYFLSTMLEIISNFCLKINMHLFSLKWRVWRRTEWNFLDVAVSVIGLIAFVAVPIQTYIVQVSSASLLFSKVFNWTYLTYKNDRKNFVLNPHIQTFDGKSMLTNAT